MNTEHKRFIVEEFFVATGWIIVASFDTEAEAKAHAASSGREWHITDTQPNRVQLKRQPGELRVTLHVKGGNIVSTFPIHQKQKALDLWLEYIATGKTATITNAE